MTTSVLVAGGLLGAGALAGFGAAATAFTPDGGGLRQALFLGATRGGGAIVLCGLVLAIGWHFHRRRGDRDRAPAP